MIRAISVILLLFATGPLFCDELDEYQFIPLKEDETLRFERYYDENIGVTVIEVYNNERDDLLFKVKGIAYNPQFLVDDGRALYFLKEVGSMDGSEELWFCDGENGTVSSILKVNPSLSISADGRLLCMDDNTGLLSGNVKSDVYPYLVLFDLSSNKIIKEYDLGRSVLQKYTYSWVEISYNNDLLRFNLELGIEGIILGTGYLDTTSHELTLNMQLK